MSHSASTPSHQRRGGRPRHRSSDRPSEHGSRNQHQRQRFQGDTETFRRPQGGPNLSVWQKILSVFGLGPKPPLRRADRPGFTESASPSGRPADGVARQAADSRPPREARSPRPVIQHEVTTGRLYVGNLSYDATESDLKDLFGGVGQVQNVEVVVNRATQRSKGFAFVEMLSVEQAKRAVAELHDKEYMGRKMLVTGAKPADPSRPTPSEDRGDEGRSADHRFSETRSFENRPPRREPRESREPREAREPRESRESREPRIAGPSATKGDVTTGIIRREQLQDGVVPPAGPVTAPTPLPGATRAEAPAASPAPAESTPADDPTANASS